MKLKYIGNIDLWSKEKLIKRCIQGDETARRNFFERYRNSIYTTCSLYLFNEDDVFDVMNQSFMKIFKKMNQLQDIHKLEGWMKRITVNTALDFLRKDATFRKRFVHTNEFSSIEIHSHEDDVSVWWNEAMNIPASDLFLEINKLPEASKIVFNLYVLEGLKHNEIADKLNIKESTSRWHLLNAREILKNRVKIIINNKKLNERKG